MGSAACILFLPLSCIRAAALPLYSRCHDGKTISFWSTRVPPCPAQHLAKGELRMNDYSAFPDSGTALSVGTCVSYLHCHTDKESLVPVDTPPTPIASYL